jgi:hypothetical protein
VATRCNTRGRHGADGLCTTPDRMGATMIDRGEPPLARLAAVFALVVAMAACSDTSSVPDPAPAPAPAPAPVPQPAPSPAPAPAPDPLAALPEEVRATRAALLAAAQAGDWDAVGSLIPTDVPFTSNYGGESDHVAFYRALDTDLLAEVVALLEGPFGQVSDVVVWPELHSRVPFAFGADERTELEGRFGAEALATWEAAGAYLGWRIGITEAGEWIFLVAGD